MPAHRKTMQELALSGALAKNPKRFASRADEPHDARPLGDPPAHLRPAEIVAWHEIETVATPGSLGFSDRLATEVLSVLLTAFREQGPALPDPKLRRLESMLRELGLTPAARSRIRLAPRELPAQPNRFANNGKHPAN